MRCGRCGMDLSEELWVEDDHPILHIVIPATSTVVAVEKPVKIVDNKIITLAWCKDVVGTKVNPTHQFKNWLYLWMEGNLPPGVFGIDRLVDRLYRDLVAAQYKITKEEKPKVKIENSPPGLFDRQSETPQRDEETAYRITRDQARDVAIRSGLDVNTVMDLLEKGWIYRLEVDKPDKWVKEF